MLNNEQKIQLPELGQIGMVVRDIDSAVEFYSSQFGIGPWEIEEINIPSTETGKSRYAWQGMVAFARLGSIEIELIQVIAGKSIHTEFLDRGREGLHHLGFFVSNDEMDKMLESLKERGIEVTQGGRGRAEGSRYAYLNTDEIGGVIFELIHRPPEAENTGQY